jgi:transcriptional regulator with XRE-family HTH domain
VSDTAYHSMFRPRRLSMHRQRAGLTVNQAAARLGVAHTSVCQWESGARGVPIGRAAALAALYDCDVSAFFTVTTVPLRPCG